MPIRIDLLNAKGELDRTQWDLDVDLESQDPNRVLNPSQITLRNGRGSALVSVSGSGDFQLRVRTEGMVSARDLSDISLAPRTEVSGMLTGDATIWEGLIHVVADVIVPSGHVLTIRSNTWVLIDGVTSGTTAADLVIEGAIQSLGTADSPVVITCSDAARNWGQIRHNNAAPSLYRATWINRGGRAAGEGHTSTAPVIRPAASTLRFEDCVISDLRSPAGTAIGKILQSTAGSDIAIHDCLFARARMGPEISGTALDCANTHFMEMRGPDDDDALYIHTLGAAQAATVRDCVVSGMDDDGIDTLNANVLIRSCIVRDVFDKGMSLFGDQVHVQRCLVVDSDIAISTKANDNQTARTHIDHCTLLGRSRGIAAENKGGAAPNATVLYFVTNSILRATQILQNAIYTDYDPAQITVTWSNLGESWPGAGNQLLDPAWLAEGEHDYRLEPGSPCIDAGDPAGPTDWDGSDTDIGAFTFEPPAPTLVDVSHGADGTFHFALSAYSNRVYRLERSQNFQSWEFWTNVNPSASLTPIADANEPQLPWKFYRAVVGP